MKPAVGYLFAILTVLMWSFLAFLGTEVSHLPPLVVTGAALTLSGLAGLVRASDWRVPPETLFVGIGGIFGYHFLYFSALRSAPAVEANLINYLWPLLIVLLSPLVLPGNRLKLNHIVGGLFGLTGVYFVFGGAPLGFHPEYWRGYLYAALAAVIWAVYSLWTRRLPPFSTAAVGAFCLSSGLLALMIWAITTGDQIPVITPRDGLYLGLISIGPLGGAFFTWDAALKRGDPRVIGAVTYLTPLFSTLILIILGEREFTTNTVAALLTITAGAVIGSLDILRPPPPPVDQVSTDH